MKTTKILLVLVLFFFQKAVAQSGTLDDSFGDNGVARNSTGIKDQVRSIKIQKDRKTLVLTGIRGSELYDIVLTRYLSNGVLDAGFGEGGIVKTKLSIEDFSSAKRIFFQLDQKILITGYTSRNQAIIVRYLSDGTLDTTFGGDNNGVLVLPYPPNEIEDVMVQSDGKYLVAQSSDRVHAITRFNVDGTLDRSYGNGGTASTGGGESRYSSNSVDEMLLTESDEVILAGTHGGGGLSGFYYYNRAMVFNNVGKITQSYFELTDNNGTTIDAAFDTESNLYMATYNGAVFKLDAALDLDKSFGTDGYLEGFSSGILSIYVDNENNIIISESDTVTGVSSLKKYTSDGVLDTSFGAAGTVVISEKLVVNDINFHENGKILVGGTTLESTTDIDGTDSLLLSYNGTSSVKEESSIASFTLINAKTNMPMLYLEDGKSYPINNIELAYLGVVANIISDKKFKSYNLKLEGPVTFSRTENVAPYALFGDLAGDFFGKTLLAGTYTMTGTPYTKLNAMGEAAVPLKISFELVNTLSRIESFNLVDSATGGLVERIEEGSTLSLDRNLSYSIIANTNPKVVGSVVMELSGGVLSTKRIENKAPYAIFGHSGKKINGNRFSEGSHTITATLFSEEYGNGIAGEKRTVDFSTRFYTETRLLENPTHSSNLGILFGERFPEITNAPYSVYTSLGVKIAEGSVSRSFGGGEPLLDYVNIDLSTKLTDPGVYILVIGPDTLQFVYSPY